MEKNKISRPKAGNENPDPVKQHKAGNQKKDDKWNKVKSVNLKGKKVDADPDKESDKPVDILSEPRT